MRPYLLFLFVVLAFNTLKAQNPPCQAYAAPSSWSSNGTVTITAYDSSAFPVSTYLWNTGETSEEITVSAAGDYCVTITYEDGCTASDCYYLSDSCYVFLWSYWPDSNTVQLIADAQPYYLGSATYLWSTGETTSSIYVSTPGSYCVTITKDYGCSATACINVGAPPPPPCQLYFWEIPDTSGNGGVWLKTSLDTDGNATYLWDNGATTSSIHVTEPGTYCVTATNGADCTKSHCFNMSCKVYVEQNGVELAANPAIGTAPYTFLWSTGETTQTITPNAQGNYWVTVTDATGCTSENYGYYHVTCNASITYNSDNTLTASMNGDGPFTYIWSPGGFTTQSITPTESGYYNVHITSANGCVGWASRYWYGPDDCRLILSHHSTTDSIVGDSAYIFLEIPGNWADWEFEWSTGSTESYLGVLVGGEYCVTATNTANGCTTVACTWVQPDNACYAQINSVQMDLATVELSVTGGPDPIVAYAWSTGDNTPTTEVTESGQYGVTVTNAAGCTVSAYRWIFRANDYLNIQVILPDSSNVGNNGVHADIYLIEYDPAQGGILTAIDTVATYSWTNSSAFVSIQNVPPGVYLVKAALKPNSNGYDEHLPTYYGGALLWSDATPVVVNAISGSYSVNNIYIPLVPGQNPGGPGFIGGFVNQGANFAGFAGNDEAESLGEGDPFPGASIVLTLQDGTPVAATLTNAEGEYGFPNLAWGTYILTIDIPGLEPVSITVTIGPDQPSAQNINFKVDEDSATLPTQEVGNENPVRIFPNPVHDLLTVELPAPAELTLVNTQGQAVLRTQENSPQVRLSLRDLPDGVYFLNIRMANNTQVLKVMIE